MKKKWKKLGFNLLLASGIAVVLSWSYIWTNLNYYWQRLAHRDAPALRQPAQENAAPPTAQDGTTAIEGSTRPKAESNMLKISSLGIEAPLVYTSGKTEESFQEALKNGVAHYPGTAAVGEQGNSYFFGHSSDYIWSSGRYKSVFALLPKIKIGERIVITDQAGLVYTYEVAETRVVESDAVDYLSQDDKSKRLLTLQTSYPVGTALKRFLAIAQLVD